MPPKLKHKPGDLFEVRADNGKILYTLSFVGYAENEDRMVFKKLSTQALETHPCEWLSLGICSGMITRF